ncbi:MAG: tRNA uridine-5-carboxymethylaminomethyl(34) synthesis GTPase MnmE [Parvibaculales bacterium]
MSGAYSEKTIFALSTPPGRAALAVVRLSGSACDAVLRAMGVKTLPPPRMASLRRLRDGQGQPVDEALILRFMAPHSFTGEDMVELHLHGGAATVEAVLAVLAELPDCAAAAGGDFTRRAVMNGKLDLTAAEAIADLVDAEGSAQAQQALRQLSGGLRDMLEGWRDGLKTALAHLEADLEFADEELPGGLGRAALAGLPALRDAMQAQLNEKRGLRLREGLRIALLGPPNAGKSSLLNNLAGREAAIVSARAGTTRDVVEVAMVMAGVPVTLVDTAGLREARDDIEREGVRRALQQAELADIQLWLQAPDVDTDDDAELPALPPQGKRYRVMNKIDLVAEPGGKAKNAAGDFAISAISGAGVEALLAALQADVAALYGAQEAPVLTRERHYSALAEALAQIDRALAAANAGVGLELAAEDLRLAMRSLGRITGAVDVEALLDIVFADFCIGK